jgi:hypothetical protein
MAVNARGAIRTAERRVFPRQRCVSTRITCPSMGKLQPEHTCGSLSRIPVPALLNDQPNCCANFRVGFSAGPGKTCCLNLGTRSVTNDVENVLRKIEHFHQAPIFGYKLLYRDSEGIWDGIQGDGKRASFFPLRETEEGRARNKLLNRK